MAGEKRAERDFGLGLSLFLSVLAGVFFWRGRELVVSPLLGAAVVVCGITLLWPALLRPLYWGMSRVALGIGWLNTRILLALVFYLAFTPLGWILRLLGKDLMDRSWNPAQESYWQDRSEETYNPAQDEKQF